MKNKKWMIFLCLTLVLVLGACGKSKDTANSSQAESVESPKQIADTVKDDRQAASEQETGSQEEVPDPEMAQVPVEYAMAVVVTINPQVKLYLNEENVIIGVEYLNEDARTAFRDIDFSGATVEEGVEKIIHAAVEKEFLTDGKDVSIDVAEVRKESCDGEAVCAELEAAVTKAAEKDHVEVVVTAKMSAEPVEAETPKPSEETASEAETPKPSGEAVSETKTTERTETEATTQQETGEPCPACGGTGICPECGGGTLPCKRCGGSLWESCGVCNGTGTQTCHGCKGSGTDAADGSPCRHCGGAGTITCEICGGAGGKPCSICHGKGVVSDDCILCHGGKKCTACGGTGIKK